MTSLSFPYTLTANTPEDVAQLNANLDAIKSILNGNVDNTNLAAAAAIKGNQIAAWANVVTSLPSSPYDGQVIVFQADLGAGALWVLRYTGGSGSAYKWHFLGGPPMYAEVTTAETTTSTSYAALATAGPTVTLPLAGDYDVKIGARIAKTTATAGTSSMSYDIGGTGAVDADWVQFDQGGGSPGNIGGHVYRVRRKTGLTAVALTAKYKVSAGTGAFQERFMEVVPVRLG